MLTSVRDWFKKPNVRLAFEALAASAVVVLLAFLVMCHWPKPPRIEYRDVVKDRIVEKEVVKTVTIHDQVDRVRVVHEVRVETRADGTKIEIRRDTDDKAKETKDTQAAVRVETKVVEHEHTVTLTSTCPPGPRWSLGVDVGGSIAAALGGAPGNRVPGAPGWMTGGVTVARRVAGPVWLGVRAGADGSLAATAAITW